MDVFNSEHFIFLMMQIPLDDEVAQKFFHKDSLEIIIYFVFEAISSRGYENVKNELFEYSCRPTWISGSEIAHTPQLQWKYHITVDGNTCAWVRLPWQMLSGSVPIKVLSPKIEYFYSGLEPWVNYVPVKSDYSDLVENVKWLIQNDDKAKEISENA